MVKFLKNHFNCQSGYMAAELLVATSLSVIIFGSVVKEYTSSVTYSHDLKIKQSADSTARSIVNIMGFELRMAGNGVPFDQANFQIGEDTLSDSSVTEPIMIAGSTATQIQYRLNERGVTYTVTADFDPTSSLNLYIDDTASLVVGDKIYISNSTVAEDDALYGEVDSINAGSSYVTLDGTYVMSPGATFLTGSVMEAVSEITITSAADGSGVTRTDNSGTILLAPNTTFTIDYVDSDLNSLTLPLTQTTLRDNLAGVNISLTLTPPNTMKALKPAGGQYTSSITHLFAIKNLNY